MTASPPFPSIDSPGRDVMFRELYRRVCAIEQRVGISTGKANQLNLTNEFINEFVTVVQGRHALINLEIERATPLQWIFADGVVSSHLIPWWSFALADTTLDNIADWRAQDFRQKHLLTLWPGRTGRPARVLKVEAWCQDDWTRPDTENNNLSSYEMYLGEEADMRMTVAFNEPRVKKYGRFVGFHTWARKGEKLRLFQYRLNPPITDIEFHEPTSLYVGAWITHSYPGFPPGGFNRAPGSFSVRITYVSYPPPTPFLLAAENPDTRTLSIGPVYAPF